MSENVKFILRPKVRFSQFSDKEGNIEEHCKDANLQANGPKIRSIVTLKKPIRIVDPTKSTGVHEKDIPLRNCEIKTPACSGDITSQITQNTIVSNNNVPQTEVSTILHDADSSQNKKKNEKLLQIDKNIRTQSNILKHRRNVSQKDKENKNIVLNKSMPKNTNKTRTESYQLTQPVIDKKLKFSSSSNDMYKIGAVSSNVREMTKSISTSSIMKNVKKQTKIKPTVSNIMPCYKYKTGMRNKISPVKKTVLHDITGPKIKTFVGPGVSHERHDDMKTNSENKKYITSNVEKWMQPKYNSITCTLDKLEEIKQQKIIRDINNFSHAQKSFLNGKVKS